MTSTQDQNLSMERLARVSFPKTGLCLDDPFFNCWGRDCPCHFGVLGIVKDEIWLNSLFVWSRKERLYLVPKRDIVEWKKPDRYKSAERSAQLNADRDRYDFLIKTKGKAFAKRWAAQMTGEKFSKNLIKDVPKIKADGRRVRLRCPLCKKVSILSYNATGAANDDAQREQNQKSGYLDHLLLSQKQPSKPP